jgi:hypothetical protein
MTNIVGASVEEICGSGNAADFKQVAEKGALVRASY